MFLFRPAADWRKSQAHLLFLSKFRDPHIVEDFTKSDDWKGVLKQPPAHAIERFVKDGMLTRANLAEQLTYQFKVTDLKSMLKQRGLQVSGRKEDMVTRLIDADAASMTSLVALLEAYVATKQGRDISEAFLQTESQKRSRAEEQTATAIRARDFKKASQIVANFEAEQVFPRGMGIDWKHYNTARDERIINNLFSKTPKKLAAVSPGTLEELRTAAGMFHLVGPTYANSLVENLDMMGTSVNGHVAMRMLFSSAIFTTNIEEYRSAGRKVTIKNCNDHLVCQVCRALEGKEYDPNEVPELPYELCTCEFDCRCCI